jgi:hypothetical protein
MSDIRTERARGAAGWGGEEDDHEQPGEDSAIHGGRLSKLGTRKRNGLFPGDSLGIVSSFVSSRDVYLYTSTLTDCHRARTADANLRLLNQAGGTNPAY